MARHAYRFDVAVCGGGCDSRSPNLPGVDRSNGPTAVLGRTGCAYEDAARSTRPGRPLQLGRCRPPRGGDSGLAPRGPGPGRVGVQGCVRIANRMTAPARRRPQMALTRRPARRRRVRNHAVDIYTCANATFVVSRRSAPENQTGAKPGPRNLTEAGSHARCYTLIYPVLYTLGPGSSVGEASGSRHVATRSRTAQLAAKRSRAGTWDEVVGVHSSKSYQCGPSCQELVHSYASKPRRLRCMSALICGSGSTS